MIAGQGTIGLEIVEDLPAVATGAGAAVRRRSRRPASLPPSRRCGRRRPRRRRLDGTRARPCMRASPPAGRSRCEEVPTLADSLGGGIGLDNRLTFAMCRDLLDDVVLLTEDGDRRGHPPRLAARARDRRGRGAVGIAALLAGKVRPVGPDRRSSCSGRNIDASRCTGASSRRPPHEHASASSPKPTCARIVRLDVDAVACVEEAFARSPPRPWRCRRSCGSTFPSTAARST